MNNTSILALKLFCSFVFVVLFIYKAFGEKIDRGSPFWASFFATLGAIIVYLFFYMVAFAIK